MRTKRLQHHITHLWIAFDQITNLRPLNETTAIEAAKIDVTMKKKVKGWGLAGSIVYATGSIKEAKIITGDLHFRNLKTSYSSNNRTTPKRRPSRQPPAHLKPNFSPQRRLKAGVRKALSTYSKKPIYPFSNM